MKKSTLCQHYLGWSTFLQFVQCDICHTFYFLEGFPKVTQGYPRLPKIPVPCSYLSLHAVSWACTQFHELAYNSMRLHAVSSACMQFHELTCNSMRLNAVLQASMPSMCLHAVPCSSMCLRALHIKFLISLSEQFTRNLQCLLPFKYPLKEGHMEQNWVINFKYIWNR